MAILILAAGNSSRMKSSKQLLPVGNTTLLGRVIENAQKSHANKVICVLGANAENITRSIKKYRIETLLNPDFKTGLSSSIVVGINHMKNLDFDAVLITLGDQPLVDSRHLNTLLNVFKEHPKKIIASSYSDGLGVPVVIPRPYYADLMQLEGDKGAKTFISSRIENSMTVESNRLLDIDTKEDYENLIKKLTLET